MDILEDNDSFTLSQDIHGPLLMVAVSIEFVFSFIINLFLLIFTLFHPKTLKEPSIIFLTNFVLVSLLLTVIFMPSIIVTAAAGEWVFGRTPEEKNGTCQFIGCVFTFTSWLIVLTLGVIFVDRFLLLNIIESGQCMYYIKLSPLAYMFMQDWSKLHDNIWPKELIFPPSCTSTFKCCQSYLKKFSISSSKSCKKI